MLVALTVERYLAVCRLGQTRTFEAQKTPLVAFCLSLVAVALYLPYLFRSDVMQCTGENGQPVYRKRENPSFPHSTLWSVYLWIIEVIFKVRVQIFLSLDFRWHTTSASHINLSFMTMSTKALQQKERIG